MWSGMMKKLPDGTGWRDDTKMPWVKRPMACAIFDGLLSVLRRVGCRRALWPAPPPPGVVATPPDPLERWRTKVCSSAAVILAQPISTKTFLNEQETFLYTNYEIAVERWIRPASNSALIPGR